MKLHKNWEVTPNGLAKLQALSEDELRKVIKEKKLFAGFTTDFANKQNELIYGKINSKRAEKEAGKADAPKTAKRNGKNNKGKS